MSRSGYSGDYGGDFPGQIKLFDANVGRAVHGARGQRLLRDIAAGMDALPERELGWGSLEAPDGLCCALGCAAKHRGLPVEVIDPTKFDIDDSDVEDNAKMLGVSKTLVREVSYANDECGVPGEKPSERWVRMRRWVANRIDAEVQP